MYTFIREVINKNFVDDALKYEGYENILFNRSYMRHEINRIQSETHNRESYRINNISLSFYNGKKYILKHGCSSLSHFQNLLVYHIKNNIVECS